MESSPFLKTNASSGYFATKTKPKEAELNLGFFRFLLVIKRHALLQRHTLILEVGSDTKAFDSKIHLDTKAPSI